MKIAETMTSDVQLADPNQTIQQAAKYMADCDCGILPVGENDRLIGMITDRDIAIRAVACGKGPDTPIREVMSQEVCYCYEDQEHDEVAANMAEIKVRRLPVVDRNKRLVGIVSLSDIAVVDTDAAEALCGITEPGGEHSQSTAM